MTKQNALLKKDSQKFMRANAGRIALDVLLALSVTLALFSAASGGGSFLFGCKPYFVAGESMEPSYKKYSLVLVKSSAFDDVRPGDVIAFKAPGMGGGPALHRVVSVTPDALVTKGDANRAEDFPPVGRSAFLGREIWHTNFTAGLITAMKTRGRLFLAAALTAVLISVFIRSCGKFGRAVIHAKEDSDG